MGSRIKSVTVEEVRKVKMLHDKGIENYQISEILGRSYTTVCRITNGSYDFMLNEQEDAAKPENVKENSRADALLESLSADIHTQNEVLYCIQSELKIQTSYMAAILDALNDLKNKPGQPQKTVPAEAAHSKYPGDDFPEWGEVVRRIEHYGDKFIAESLRGVKARKDGTTLYLVCSDSARNFLKRSPVAISRIKQQCRNVIGYDVEVKLLDQ